MHVKTGPVSDGGKTTQEGFCDYYYLKFVKKSLTWIQKVMVAIRRVSVRILAFLIFLICFVYLD